MIWPHNYEEIWEERAQRLRAIESDHEIMLAAKEHYKKNPIDYINHWGVTYDPRLLEDRVIPLVMFDRQEDLVSCIVECYFEKENILNEKTRDMGSTWICVGISDWLWTFYDHVAIGWGSRKGEYVDKHDDPKAIFPKLRMWMDYKPGFLRPRDFDLNIHAPHMRIINPENGSSIVGEAGEGIGRGGRTSIYFKDESAHYENPESTQSALNDNTTVQVDISSVYGTGTVFHRRRSAGIEWFPGAEIPKGKTRVFISDWRHHPAKDQAWYDQRRRTAEEEGLLHLFAQEVERDYSAAVENTIIPMLWINAAVDAHLRLNIQPTGVRVGGQDVADGGSDKNALAMADGVILFHASHWGGEAGDAAAIAVPMCVENNVKELYYDSNSVGAGFKVQINNMMEKPNWPRSLRVMPWSGGGKVLDPDDPIIPGDRDSPLNKDQYGNLKAQSWFRLRTRFNKTFRMINYGEEYPHEELISLDSRIPRLEELKNELSQAVKKMRPNGQMIVDKNPDGTKSPNLADAVVQCYNPVRVLSILDVL